MKWWMTSTRLVDRRGLSSLPFLHLDLPSVSHHVFFFLRKCWSVSWKMIASIFFLSLLLRFFFSWRITTDCVAICSICSRHSFVDGFILRQLHQFLPVNLFFFLFTDHFHSFIIKTIWPETHTKNSVLMVNLLGNYHFDPREENYHFIATPKYHDWLKRNTNNFIFSVAVASFLERNNKKLCCFSHPLFVPFFGHLIQWCLMQPKFYFFKTFFFLSICAYQFYI